MNVFDHVMELKFYSKQKEILTRQNSFFTVSGEMKSQTSQYKKKRKKKKTEWRGKNKNLESSLHKEMIKF